MRISELVLHNDHQIIALSKPAGMPVQNDKTGDKSLHRIAQAYCKRDLFLVHRLDRPCSGLVIMAKTREAAAHLSDQWQDRTIAKTYLAIVPKGIEPKAGKLEHNLVKKGNKSIATKYDRHSRDVHAVLQYRIMQSMDTYDVLEIKMESGYFHQIRAQLAEAGCPIRGDVKYGARRANADRSIGLHCFEIQLIHPGSLEEIVLRSPVPEHDIWGEVHLK